MTAYLDSFTGEETGLPMTTLTLSKALNEGLRKAMENDPKVLIMGEDVGPALAVCSGVTDGLQKDFGEDRVVDTPLAESGIIGTAIGLALRGYRPVCEIQFDGFVFPAFDQITTQPGQDAVPLARQGQPARGGCGSRSAAASAPSSTTASRRKRCSRIPQACEWSPAGIPPTRTP